MSISHSILQKTYVFLEDPSLYSQPPIYTPFKQTILADRYREKDPNWSGACRYLSTAWMCQKIISDNILAPSVFQLKNKEIIVLGDNNPQGVDLKCMEGLFDQVFNRTRGSRNEIDIADLEQEYLCEGIKALMVHFENYGPYDQCLFFNAFLNLKVEGSDWKRVGHLCGFVKKDDQCAWFDPNFGEAAFANYGDFMKWFEKEATEGVLRYLIDPNVCMTNKGEKGDADYKAEYYRIDFFQPYALTGAYTRFKREFEKASISFLISSDTSNAL